MMMTDVMINLFMRYPPFVPYLVVTFSQGKMLGAMTTRRSFPASPVAGDGFREFVTQALIIIAVFGEANGVFRVREDSWYKGLQRAIYDFVEPQLARQG